MTEELCRLIGKSQEDVLGDFRLSVFGDPRFTAVPDREYVCFADVGIDFAFEAGLLVCIYFHVASANWRKRNDSELPVENASVLSRAEVRARLGEPAFSRDAGHVEYLGWKPAGDRYLLEGLAVHVEYGGAREAVSLITVMTPQNLPS